MKQYIYQMMILAVSTCLWSCQDDDPKPTVVEEPDWKLELVENDPEPEWEMPESGIYQFSMDRHNETVRFPRRICRRDRRSLCIYRQ